jgi:ABC-type Fe3+ transport system substrate-binding protein
MIHARTRIPFARSIAAATFAAAVAGTFSAASAEVTTYSDLAALEAAAQKEGTLNLDVAPEYAPFLVSGFKEVYPWATINVRQASPGSIQAKWAAELSAGVKQVDVALIHFAAAKQFIPQGAIAQVKVPNDDLLPERLRDPDSYSHAMNQLASAIIYNNKLIDGGPATLQELTDPKWKDKLILDDPKLGSDGGYVLASMRKTLGSDDAWKAWLKGLKDNGAVITPTSGDAFQAVLRGDRPLCLCAYYDYVYNAAQGAPLGATFFNQDTSGIIVRPIVAVIAAAAQHPAMSALFVNWALSDKGGQKGMADSGRTPAVPVPGDEKVNLPDGVKAANFYEYMADYVANQKAYNEVFKEVLQ